VLRRRSPAAALLALSLVALAGACSEGDDDESSSPEGGDARATSGGELIGPADEGIDGVQAYRIDSHAHTEENLTYEPSPPTGGEHFPVPATCGFYETDPPTDELIVHDLEHGAIWIAYDPELADAQVTALSTLVAQQAKVIGTPRPDMPSPIVVSAWGRQLILDSVDDPRLVQFITTYRNSQNAPEPNAACQGVGTPSVPSPTA
jgi:hypothetical protein